MGDRNLVLVLVPTIPGVHEATQIPPKSLPLPGANEWGYGPALHGRCTCTFLRYSRVSSIYGGARSLIFILNSSTGDRPADHYTVKMAPLTLHSAKHMVSAVSALVYARPFEGKDNRYHISGPALSLFWLHTTPLARRKHQVREVALSRLGLLDRLKTTSATVAREAIADKSVRGV